MTTMKGLLLGVSLSVMIGCCVSQGFGGHRGYGMYGGFGGGGHNPGARFSQYCYIYQKERWDEGHGRCYWKVLKEVFDKVKDFSRHDRHAFRELYGISRSGLLCFVGGHLEANQIIPIHDPCQGFDAACSGRTVDYCSTLRARARPRPPAAPAPTPRPQPPATPRGRGI
ncbi:uncharacterized protein LOC129272338 [Lytechinus pictus]|uniref:uncharacterized protein LOC129272338 n=1 Tax=Lytechinus pictus TaxID=7653 RepID=UPI00240DD806|nr:uncharacterized protein LOC129272338 [Lytechinus pictus]